MIPESIQKLIIAHREDNRRLEIERTQQPIKVSKAVSFIAVLYERMRNTIEYEEEHLLRKRAIKRIMIRMNIFKGGNPKELAENVIKEVIWAQYLNDFPVPVGKIPIVTRIFEKYQAFVRQYKISQGKKMPSENMDLLYGICAFEVERVLVPYNHKDALVNAQFYFINSMGILSAKNLPKEYEPIQTYIACHRASMKSDDETIAFHLFYNKFPFWINPNQDQLKVIAQNLDLTLKEIHKHLNYQTTKKQFREVVRQSIPFKILDKVVRQNLKDADILLQDETRTEEQIQLVCEDEYKENKRKLNTTIIRSIIYIFITKVFLAFVIEIPYELAFMKHLNFIALGINILFPVTTMFIVATTFSIPSEKNTYLLKQMIKSILNPTNENKKAFTYNPYVGSAFKFIFQFIYFAMFIITFGAILYILYLLDFNIASMLVFIIFFSTIFFVASKLRNTAQELRVVNTSPSIFSPFIDLFSTPFLILGKKLSEGASQLNFLTIFFDFLIEAPFKKIIRVFEEWNNFIRETKEEIV